MNNEKYNSKKKTDPGCLLNISHFPRWPSYGEDEIDAVKKVLRSGDVNYWTGDECRNFEQEFAGYVGVSHCISVMNGTVALELALHALGIGPGDDVIVPSRTFIATASSVVLQGAKPIFADVDPVSQNVTVDTISSVLTSRTKAIIVVHLSGWPCDMDPIMEFARKNDLRVIEDCAQAHGAEYKGRMVGSIGDAAAFSFCQDKIITTGGEGGMMTTNNTETWLRAWTHKDHGKNHTKMNSMKSEPGFQWVHDAIGTNYRMTEMQAAIGRIQLGKLHLWLTARRSNAGYLDIGFAKIRGLRLAIPPAHVKHAYYKYYFFLKSDRLRENWSRERIIQEINSAGIPCYNGSCSEIYLEKAFEIDQQPEKRLKVAQELGETSLMCLVHPTLGEEQMLATCEVVDSVMKQAIA